jgi:hypothetical protein
LRPGGQVILVDFRRIQGQSSAWVLNHVRAGQEVFTREILAAGFKQIEEVKFLSDQTMDAAIASLNDLVERNRPTKKKPWWKLW